MVARTRAADAAVTTTLEMSRTTAEVWGGNAQGIAAFWGRPENRFMHSTEVGLHRESIEGPRWHPQGSRPGGQNAQFAFVRAYTRALYDAGVPLLAGTDAPTVFGVAGFSLLRELAELRDGLALTPSQVLAIATRNPGERIGRYVNDLPFGAIAPGRRADLLLLEADPLEDLGALEKRVAVMARGRLYTNAELQRGIERLAVLYAGACCPR
jgi:hypothetical protein